MAESACECERSGDANLAQSLHLLNSKEIQGRLTNDGGRAARLAKDKRAIEAKIRELYLIAFARAPTKEELSVAQEYLKKQENVRQGFEDVVWALMNTKEFLFNH